MRNYKRCDNKNTQVREQGEHRKSRTWKLELFQVIRNAHKFQDRKNKNNEKATKEEKAVVNQCLKTWAMEKVI